MTSHIRLSLSTDDEAHAPNRHGDANPTRPGASLKSKVGLSRRYYQQMRPRRGAAWLHAVLPVVRAREMRARFRGGINPTHSLVTSLVAVEQAQGTTASLPAQGGA